MEEPTKKEKELKKRKHYCIDHGHANYITSLWSYIYCGRCGEQIGDQLGSVFDTRKSMVIGHKCKICNAIRRKLSKMDLKIVEDLEKDLISKKEVIAEQQ